MNTKSSRKKR